VAIDNDRSGRSEIPRAKVLYRVTLACLACRLCRLHRIGGSNFATADRRAIKLPRLPIVVSSRDMEESIYSRTFLRDDNICHPRDPDVVTIRDADRFRVAREFHGSPVRIVIASIDAICERGSKPARFR